MALTQLITDTRDLLKDTQGLYWTTAQVTRYVNLARQQVATLSGCIRILVYGTSPFGATAQAGTAVAGGATAGVPATTTFLTIPGVEKYGFDYANAYVQAQNGGVEFVNDVADCAVSWGGIRPEMRWLPWEDLQAYARSYNIGVTSYPMLWSTLGDGNNGQVWLFPVPTNALEMEWVCYCSPRFIFTDSDPEALPTPWQRYVPFYAAHLGYMNSQRYQQAGLMLDLFEKNSGLSRAAADRGKQGDNYWQSNMPY